MDIDSQGSLTADHAAFRYCLLVLLARDRPSLRSLENALNHDPELCSNPEVRSSIERIVEAANSKEIPLPKIDELITRRDSRGITFTSSRDWPGGVVIAMDRNTFQLHHNDPKVLPDTAVYFLYTDRVTAEGQNELYIGESKDVTSRLFQHQGQKDFWTNIVIATHPDLTKSHAKAVESKLIASSKLANRYKLKNGNDGQAENLGDHDRQIVQSVVAGLSGLFELARYDFLKPAGTGLFTYHFKLGGNRGTLALQLRLVDAKQNLVVVLVGSRLSAYNNLVPDEIIEAKLETYGELRDGVWIFTSDAELVLQSPSYSVLGKTSSAFKSQNGVRLSRFLNWR